ncbi:MAG: MBL fold metallo-hydrolase [Myxococcota bacterium]
MVTMSRRRWLMGAAALAGCEPLRSISIQNVDALMRGAAPPPVQLPEPRVPGAQLAALWVGHATVLLQLGERYVITDPVFTNAVGQFSSRLVDPGLSLEAVPALDACVISHMHFDHLSLGTLSSLETRIDRLFLPVHGRRYLPSFDFPMEEVPKWVRRHHRGLRLTSVPVRHEGHRYGFDDAWMGESYGGWVVQSEEHTVYFGGDTAWQEEHFAHVAATFPSIDLALLPIGPVFPRAFMDSHHIDGRQAIDALRILNADAMIPIHYETFAHGADRPGEALRYFREALDAAPDLEDRVVVLPIGGQVVLA